VGSSETSQFQIPDSRFQSADWGCGRESMFSRQRAEQRHGGLFVGLPKAGPGHRGSGWHRPLDSASNLFFKEQVRYEVSIRKNRHSRRELSAGNRRFADSIVRVVIETYFN
jgi:hypothetical protein